MPGTVAAGATTVPASDMNYWPIIAGLINLFFKELLLSYLHFCTVCVFFFYYRCMYYWGKEDVQSVWDVF